MKEAVIVSGVRTPIGNYGGTLKDTPAIKLGSIVIRDALKRVGLRPKRDSEALSYALEKCGGVDLTELERKYHDWDDSLSDVKIDEVVMGNVIQAGQGQNVARQSSIYAGIPKETTAYTVNKVCASGMKSATLAAQAIAVIRELGLDLEKTNKHGSGISLGHPIGCTGARIIVTLIHEMKRQDLQFGLATLCIGGGQGMAMIVERK